MVEVVRNVENNTVKAKSVKEAGKYSWSSARGHIREGADSVLDRCFLEEEINDWKDYLSQEKVDEVKKIRQSINIGRPLGDDRFIDRIEKYLGRSVRRQKPGPKKPLS